MPETPAAAFDVDIEEAVEEVKAFVPPPVVEPEEPMFESEPEPVAEVEPPKAKKATKAVPKNPLADFEWKPEWTEALTDGIAAAVVVGQQALSSHRRRPPTAAPNPVRTLGTRLALIGEVVRIPIEQFILRRRQVGRLATPLERAIGEMGRGDCFRVPEYQLDRARQIVDIVNAVGLLHLEVAVAPVGHEVWHFVVSH